MSYVYSILGHSSGDHTLHALHASHALLHTLHAFEHLYKEKEGKHVCI